MTVSHKGRLLVATPDLDDPNFSRTIVLLLEHDPDQGAVGLVLNRPTELRVGEALEEWDGLAAAPSVVHIGGPVAKDAVICLGRLRDEADPERYAPVVGSVGTIDLTADPALVAADVENLRVFAGYSGWGAGQLESEIAEGAWFVVDAAADDALSTSSSSLWAAVLRRQKGKLALFANYPADPSVN